MKPKALKAARIAHIAIWTMIALGTIIGVCYVWQKNGCSVVSIIAAIAFYLSTCTGICLFGDIQFRERIKEEEEK